MNPSPVLQPADGRMGRRDALRLGGVTLSLGAIVAACGEGRGGDTAPGRVGNAPDVTLLPDYEVNDAVLLRTASSLELTAVYVYETAQTLDVFEGSTAELVERFVENHRTIAEQMGELTVDAGGEAWTDTNPWIMERTVAPVLAAILASDDVARDVLAFAVSLEDLAAATHQTLVPLLSTSEQRLAVAEASKLESRHSAALVLDVYGDDNRFSPALVGEEVSRTEAGLVPHYAMESQFGSVAQFELIVGAQDENGVRETFLLATPAANSFIYEELTEG